MFYKRFSNVNDHGRLHDPISATIAAAVIGAGASVYSAQEQKKQAKKALNAQQASEMEARRIQAEMKPLEESATLSLADSGVSNDPFQGLLIEPVDKKKNPMSSVSTGLSTVSSGSSLGFGV